MDKFKELLANGEFEAKLNGCIDTDKVKALAKEYGTDLTDEEVQQIIGMLKAHLSEDDLVGVAGGTEPQTNGYGLKSCRICGKTFHGYINLCYDCYNAGYR